MYFTAKYRHENDKRVKKKTPRTSITIFTTTTIKTCTCTFFLSDLKNTIYYITILHV